MDQPPANADKPRPEPSDADDPNVMAHDLLRRVLERTEDNPDKPRPRSVATSQGLPPTPPPQTGE